MSRVQIGNDVIHFACAKCLAEEEVMTKTTQNVVAGMDSQSTWDAAEALSIKEEAVVKIQAHENFEACLNRIGDIIDSADVVGTDLPKTVRDLAIATAKDAYSFFQTSPSVEALEEKTEYLEGFRGKVERRIARTAKQAE